MAPTTPTARQRLVEENQPFVRAMAAQIKEQLPREIEYDDLVAYGMQGLLEAAERFDGRAGTSFTTFAYYRVRGAIYDGLRGMGWLPRSQYARLRVDEHANAFLQNLADREAGAQAHADAAAPAAPPSLEDEVSQLSEALSGVAAIYLATLDADSAAQETAPERLEEAERASAVRGALEALPERERRLVELCYYEGRSLVDAARTLGLSKSWASRLHARAIALLADGLARSDVGPDPPGGPDP